MSTAELELATIKLGEQAAVAWAIALSLVEALELPAPERAVPAPPPSLAVGHPVTAAQVWLAGLLAVGVESLTSACRLACFT